MSSERNRNGAKYSVGKNSYEEAPIESLSSLAFNSIMCGTPLSGVGPSRGLALALSISGTRRAGRRISGGRSGRLIRGRESQSRD